MPLALTFSEPSLRATEVLMLKDYPRPEPKINEVAVEFLAAPVNTFDLLVVAGKYPVKPKSQLDGNHIGGFDGVGAYWRAAKIIQNAGLSAISQMIVQFAHLRGVKVISVIRDRALETVWDTGADVVMNESELPYAKVLKDKRIVLGLDSVFGSSAEKIASCLSAHATFVNYGQSSGGGPAAHVNVTHRQFFWNRLTFRSFRGTEQMAQLSFLA
ncbi:hypothetical protein AJ79_06888 [Helicocarpus griseus UAMH5409]|uniref:Alcohol dehydrogenase-like C-terminal domain-containing protein n=1 Tax=Helicocarpus griseus UAMH5409 TaxID=1447875 RepID=A0A2B7X8E4_9EURO|nr:hypothetical protein AJ79_06888 [Helicocarpus griseus UAMH5409]